MRGDENEMGRGQIFRSLAIVIVLLMVVTSISYASSSITVNALVNNSTGKVMIAGQISSGEGQHVTVLVINPSGGTDYIDQTTSGLNGIYQFSYILDEALEGTYTVRAGGTGIDSPKETTFKYELPVSQEKEIIGVASLSDIAVAYGTAKGDAGLPAQVEVTLDDSSKAAAGVTWDNGNPTYDGNDAGEYTFTGTLINLPANVINPDNKLAVVRVIVEEQIPVPDVIPPGEVAGIVVTEGNSRLTITWIDPVDEDFQEVRIYEGEALIRTIVKGVQKTGITDLVNETAYAFVIRTVDTTGNESDGLTVTGTPKAPASITVDVSVNNTTRVVTITGSVTSGEGQHVTVLVVNPSGGTDYIDQTTSGSNGIYQFSYMLDEASEGTYTVRAGGAGIDSPKETTFKYEQPVSQEKEIIEVASLSDISVAYGTAKQGVGLPAQVEVTLDDSSKAVAGVTWDNGNPVYDGNKAEEYTFTGTLINLPANVINSENKVAVVKVIVDEPEDEEPGDEEPGDEEPGDEEPGDEEPGDEEPGDEEPGDEEPGDEDPDDSGAPVKPQIFIDEKSGEVKIIAESVLDNANATAAANIGLDVLTKAFDSAKADNSGAKTIAIDISAVGEANGYEIVLPGIMLTEIELSKKIEVRTDKAVLTVPGNMLSGSEMGEDVDVTLTVAEADPKDLSEEVKKAIGDRPVIELSLKVDGKAVEWNNPEAPVIVSIPYSPTDEELKNLGHIAVWYIDGQGNAIAVPNGRYDAATGMVSFTVTHFSRYAIAFVFKTFEDISDYEWAKAQIEELASRGAIVGIGENKFAPSLNIKRADYTVLMVRALGLTAKIEDNFDDVKKDDYYYEAVGIAKKLGIVQGTGDNRFNPEKAITRQDMMVLTARILKMLNKLDAVETVKDLEAFSDRWDIADYAVEGMAALVKTKLVVGYNHLINPLGNATRAEVAVLMHRILDFIMSGF